jgi:serine/threonine-protein kinase
MALEASAPRRCGPVGGRTIDMPDIAGPVELPLTGLRQAVGMAVDSAGNVYVADYENNRVVKLPAG